MFQKLNDLTAILEGQKVLEREKAIDYVCEHFDSLELDELVRICTEFDITPEELQNELNNNRKR